MGKIINNSLKGLSKDLSSFLDTTFLIVKVISGLGHGFFMYICVDCANGSKFFKGLPPLAELKNKVFLWIVSKKTTELLSLTFYHVKVVCLKQVLCKFYFEKSINFWELVRGADLLPKIMVCDDLSCFRLDHHSVRIKFI